VAIHLGAEKGAPTHRVPEARAVAGKGLKGDRYFLKAQADPENGLRPGQQVTLIEEEALEALARDYGIPFSAQESRRNLLTRGVPLNHLVGKRFRVGEAVLVGVQLSEPCGYLERLTGKNVREGLVHRGGLRADVLVGGTIREGDPVEEDAAERAAASRRATSPTQAAASAKSAGKVTKRKR
jgi:MOSC domain-containing protein YiiM